MEAGWRRRQDSGEPAARVAGDLFREHRSDGGKTIVGRKGWELTGVMMSMAAGGQLEKLDGEQSEEQRRRRLVGSMRCTGWEQSSWHRRRGWRVAEAGCPHGGGPRRLYEGETMLVVQYGGCWRRLTGLRAVWYTCEARGGLGLARGWPERAVRVEALMDMAAASEILNGVAALTTHGSPPALEEGVAPVAPLD
jgi:hypothetical protein